MDVPTTNTLKVTPFAFLSRRKVRIHELGHVFELYEEAKRRFFVKPNTLSVPELTRQEEKVITKEFKQLKKDTTLQKSIFGRKKPYAATHIREYWAECVALYQTHPTTLSMYLPNTYTGLRKIFGPPPKRP